MFSADWSTRASIPRISGSECACRREISDFGMRISDFGFRIFHPPARQPGRLPHKWGALVVQASRLHDSTDVDKVQAGCPHYKRGMPFRFPVIPSEGLKGPNREICGKASIALQPRPIRPSGTETETGTETVSTTSGFLISSEHQAAHVEYDRTADQDA